MALYQPKYKDPKTGETLTASVWWMDFTYCGKRVRESTGCTKKTLAVEAVKRRRTELERAIAGLPSEGKETRIRTVGQVCQTYKERYADGHKAKSFEWVSSLMKHVVRHLEAVMIPDLNEDRIRAYIRARLAEEAGNRSVNIEVSILARSIGRKRSELWPSVKPLRERNDVGKALAPEEEQRLLEASLKAESPLIGPFIRIALTTGMRSGEILGLTWGRVNLVDKFITVGDSKSKASSGRLIPMNADLQRLLAAFAGWHQQECGGTEAHRYLFPFRLVRGRYDSTRRMSSIRKSWLAVRDSAEVSIRIHDLRHTACSKMAESAVSEFGMLSIMGHVSRGMLKQYSHVRMGAKRLAVDALCLEKVDQAGVDQIGHVKDSPKVTAFQ